MAFSYCPSESALSYTNFFGVLNSKIFIDGILPPKVVLTDDSADMRLLDIAALPQSCYGRRMTHRHVVAYSPLIDA